MTEKGAEVIKRSKYSAEQVIFALRQAETSTAVSEVCRKMGITEQRKDYNQIRPYSSLGYKPPAPEAVLTMATNH